MKIRTVMRMAQEKSFENKIKRYLKERGCEPIKFMGNAFTKAGVPDIIVSVNGYCLFIEVKAQNGKPTELQLATINKLRGGNSRAFAYVAYPSGWEKLKDIIDGLLIDSFNREEDIILK